MPYKNKEKAKEYGRQWRLKNKEKIKEKAKEYGRQYRLKNKEKISEYGRKIRLKSSYKKRMEEWRLKNKQKILENRRQWRLENKEDVKKYMKEYFIQNNEKLKGQNKEYYLKNKERLNLLNKQWYLDNIEKVKQCNYIYRKGKGKEILAEARRKLDRKKRKEDPNYRITKNLRSRLRSALKGSNKSAITMKLIGCSIFELWKHLESHPSWEAWMTRENYGKMWHVDHIKPCASFDLTCPNQQRICFNYTNLQPLEAIENMRKGAKIL